MSSRSDKHDEHSETTIKAEIRKTLLSINDTTHKIKSELDAINVLTKKNGQLHIGVTHANEVLTKVAKDMNISKIENLLNDDEEDNEALPHFGNVFSSSAFQEKILQCLNDV
ncbi:uncharacterized protein LOC114878802 [Osmia bicornis bicornis]|uniref:uncharacterized protein LOC114878802 n=1 Tax=Osmia bicornis bicornis TaxID=1437191 RepID=UPI0010F5981A|nr:uncharacterized protein LOC114878802 [Osmia bicornis bicornis]